MQSITELSGNRVQIINLFTGGLLGNDLRKKIFKDIGETELG